MKRFFCWLCKPPVLSLLGVLLLSLIIWFEGPLLAFNGSEPFASTRVRWFVIGLLFLIWGALLAWNMVAARRANATLTQGVAGEGQPAPGSAETTAELALLRQRLQQAMALLKKSSSASRNLVQLPWYLFVGAPGSGKTTALVQSGLRFPLADSMGKAAIGGVGGTRNCDWWFTDEAVLLDTAGRYTTQDSYTAVDKAAWQGFLQMLRKYRRRRPVNGVIVALSVADLLQQSPAARQVQAQAIRERIKELHERLGIRFPVYVMVTKCDLLAGFVEFFDNLGRDERAQVWGMTFPLKGDARTGVQVDADLATFAAEFQLLEQQLQARVLSRVQQERDGHRRALIYSLPQQFAGIAEVLGDFLQQVFASSTYEEKALLRGVYFTSGTQQGSPIDRVMGAMAATFGLERQALPPNAISGRSYFLTNLLREVIFPEANLVSVNLKLERQRRALQWGASSLVALVFMLLCAALLTSYARNRHDVGEVALAVADVNRRAAALAGPATELPTLPLLSLLDALRALPGAHGDRSAPLLMRFGLYQGDKLGEGARAAYQNMLRALLLPRILLSMEQQLRRDSANNHDYLYETLRVYLMLGERTHFDSLSVQAWLDHDWARNLKDANPLQKQALGEHAAALLEQFGEASQVPRLNAALVDKTRLTLAGMALQQRIYNRLKRELSRSKLPEFTVSNEAGRAATRVLVRRSGEPLTRGINGLFTVVGYQKFLDRNAQAIVDVAKDGWVLGQQEAVGGIGAGQLQAAVLQLYFNDYIAQWDGLLLDVAVAPFSSLDQGAGILTVLSGLDSPLRKFLLAAARETALAGKEKPDLASVGDANKEKDRDKLVSYKNQLDSALGANDEEALPAVTPVHPVDLHFEDLHRIAGGGAPAGAPPPLDAVLAMLKDVADYLDAAAAAKRGGALPPSGDAVNKLKREAQGKPAPLAAILLAIDSSAAGLTSGSERERLNSLWGGSGGQFCNAAIQGRYPLLRSASREVTLDDFGKFFAPGGLMDDFFQKNLLQHVDMGGSQWRWRTTVPALGMSQEVLDGFQRAAKIRDAFFGGGGRQPSIRFDLKPLVIDAGLSKLTLEIDGQQLVHVANAAPRSTAFQLPSGKGNGQVRFETTPPGGTELRTDGSWAWFRMIDKGTLEAGAHSERYTLRFDFNGRKAAFELTASSVINPFRRDLLERFHCTSMLQ